MPLAENNIKRKLCVIVYRLCLVAIFAWRRVSALGRNKHTYASVKRVCEDMLDQVQPVWPVEIKRGYDKGSDGSYNTHIPGVDVRNALFNDTYTIRIGVSAIEDFLLEYGYLDDAHAVEFVWRAAHEIEHGNQHFVKYLLEDADADVCWCAKLQVIADAFPHVGSMYYAMMPYEVAAELAALERVMSDEVRSRLKIDDEAVVAAINDDEFAHRCFLGHRACTSVDDARRGLEEMFQFLERRIIDVRAAFEDVEAYRHGRCKVRRKLKPHRLTSFEKKLFRDEDTMAALDAMNDGTECVDALCRYIADTCPGYFAGYACLWSEFGLDEVSIGDKLATRACRAIE